MKGSSGDDLFWTVALIGTVAGIIAVTVVLPIYGAVKLTDALTKPKSKNPARRIEELNY